LSFGKMVLSPRKKRYELSAGIADTETDTATARVVGSLSTRVATAAADSIQEDGVSPIIPATMPFGRPVTFADKFIRSPRKRNRFMLSSVPARQPFGRPVRTDYSQLPEPVPGPAVTSVPERAKLQAVSTSPRDFSNGRSHQLAALSMADDSLFSVTGITKKTPAVSSKISTVVPAIKPVPGTSSRYLVLGSFRNRLNADAFSKQLGAFKAFVATVQLPSGTYYRVLAGPSSSGESLEGLKSRYIQATGAESWVVTLSQPMPSKTAVLR
ncbi:MAG: SPOR domain-containing protein, partial [Alphaproteobacteria bacterium]|nr:SPOR domain-containing protein [Alphaproteobacteria bacterium]